MTEDTDTLSKEEIWANRYVWKDFKDWIEDIEEGDEIYIWSDGGCQPNPGPGGWGALLDNGESRTVMTGGQHHTTNNRMELTAVLCAMDALPNGCDVKLFSDSQYVCNGVNGWMHGWAKRKWTKKDGSDVTNVDLWKEVHAIARRHRVKATWVKGHNDHPENECCDALATRARILSDEEARKLKYTDPSVVKPITVKKPKKVKKRER